MVGVAPPVAPLEGVRGGHVDVLEVVVPVVGAVSPGLWEGDTSGSPGSRSLRSGQDGARCKAQEKCLKIIKDYDRDEKRTQLTKIGTMMIQ